MKATLEEGVSKTLFIPLAARANELKQNNPVVRDEKAAEIASLTDLGDYVVDGGEIATLGILARTRVIDDTLEALLAGKPDLTLLSLGVGLDTRISRMDNGRIQSYELDLPEVIALRREYFEETERIHFIAASALDEVWVRHLEGISPNKMLILAEGLLMYFTVEEVKRLFHMLAKYFPGAHMLFDVVHSFFVGKGISHPFLWGLDKAQHIEGLNPHIRLIKAWSMGNLLKERQSPLMRIMNLLPSTRNRSQILHIEFKDFRE